MRNWPTRCATMTVCATPRQDAVEHAASWRASPQADVIECYPRPTNGIRLAITVMNSTLVSSEQARHVDHRLADIVGVHARLRPLAAVGLQHAGDHALGQRRAGIADVDLAAGDVVAPAIERGLLGQAGDAVLGHRIGDRVRARRMGGDRAVVDDAPAARLLRFHDPDGFLGAQEHAGEIDVDDLPPGLERQLLERHRRRPDPGIVEQDVEAPEGRLGLGEQRLDGLRVAHVGRDRQALRPDRVAGGRGLVELVLPPARQHDRVALPHQGQGDGFADPGAGTGDEGDLGHGMASCSDWRYAPS